MKQFLLIYECTLILFGLINTSRAAYSIAESYDSGSPYPFLPALNNDTTNEETTCDTYVTDFATNGVDRVIIVGTTLSNKLIDGRSGCVDSFSSPT